MFLSKLLLKKLKTYSSKKIYLFLEIIYIDPGEK